MREKRRTKETRQDPSSSLKSTHQLQRSGRPCAHVGPSAITISCRVPPPRSNPDVDVCMLVLFNVVVNTGANTLRRQSGMLHQVARCHRVTGCPHGAISRQREWVEASARLPKSLLWLTKNSWQIFRRKYSTCPHPSAVNAMNVPHVRRPCATPKTIGSRLGDLLYVYFDFLAEQ